MCVCVCVCVCVYICYSPQHPPCLATFVQKVTSSSELWPEVFFLKFQHSQCQAPLKAYSRCSVNTCWTELNFPSVPGRGQGPRVKPGDSVHMHVWGKSLSVRRGPSTCCEPTLAQVNANHKEGTCIHLCAYGGIHTRVPVPKALAGMQRAQ